ncbi:hypothetical protein D9613_007989 [Agrocybe pediades]|uniref:Uncharacterized protein n=1 Tax=Agrocybe pediades TaxID=84607 RepID=A0A8H4QMJ9_9AGAR|nr:hypothetical protein D9613_007989 [Agrocybe pediades]
MVASIPAKSPRTPERRRSSSDGPPHEFSSSSHDNAIAVHTLWPVVFKEMEDPRIFTKKLSKHIVGPEPLPGLPAGSLYWVHKDHPDEPCVLRFPALLRIGGEHGRTNTYFNQRTKTNRTKIKTDMLHKIKAIFELVLLPEEEKDFAGNGLYPPEAVTCSAIMFDFLDDCTREVEKNRRGSVSKVVEHGFLRHSLDSKGKIRSSFYVSAHPFFVDMEDPSTVGTGMVDDPADQTEEPGLTLDDLYDPNGRYDTLKEKGHQFAKLTPPPVFDQNDQLVLPNNYNVKLKDGMPVIVDVELRVWEYHPRSLASNEKNSSRIYELKLKYMKLLAPDRPSSPSKCKSEKGRITSYMSPGAKRKTPESPTGSPSKRARG